MLSAAIDVLGRLLLLLSLLLLLELLRCCLLLLLELLLVLELLVLLQLCLLLLRLLLRLLSSRCRSRRCLAGCWIFPRSLAGLSVPPVPSSPLS